MYNKTYCNRVIRYLATKRVKRLKTSNYIKFSVI